MTTEARMDAIYWITPAGVVWPWPCGMPEGIDGFGIPPLTIDEQAILGDGSSTGTRRFTPRELFIPFAMTGAVEEVRRSARLWASALAADPGLGKIRVTSVLNDDREIACRYSGGYELAGHDQRWMSAGVTFRAPQPFFEDTDETVLVWAALGETTSFFPIPNPDTGSFITLSQGDVITTGVIHNAGDVATWPIWEITGPGSGLVELVLASTGQTIQFSRSLAPGETITIDTRPGEKTVRAADGSNEFGALGLSELFPLVPGENSVLISIGGAESGTSARVRYRRRWLTA